MIGWKMYKRILFSIKMETANYPDLILQTTQKLSEMNDHKIVDSTVNLQKVKEKIFSSLEYRPTNNKIEELENELKQYETEMDNIKNEISRRQEL